MQINNAMKFQKLEIFKWLNQKGIYSFNYKNILNIFINEIIYLYIQDEYQIFIDELNINGIYKNNHKYLIERFYKNVFDKKVDIMKFIESKKIKLTTLEKREINKIVNEIYIKRQIKSIIIMGSLDLEYSDWTTNLLSRLNQKILLISINKILSLILNIKQFINPNRSKLKKSPEKISLSKKRSKWQLERQVNNPQRSRLINRKQFFITDIISNPKKIGANYLFIKSCYAISSYVGFKKQKFDPLYLCALELIDNPEIDFKDSNLNKFYKNPKNYKFGESFDLNINNKYYELTWDKSFSPWAHKKPNLNIHGGYVDSSFIKMRFLKIKNTINNIVEFGYIPTKKDIVKGYFLVKGSEYRFIVLQGWHRHTVLKALNSKNPMKFKYIPVTFDLDRFNKKIVLKENINNWPALKKGDTSIMDAEEIFNSYFF